MKDVCSEQEHRHILPTKTSYKYAFLSCNHFLQLLEALLFYMATVSTAFCLLYFQLKALFSPILTSLMKLEHERQDT
jgi:predicted membrane protein